MKLYALELPQTDACEAFARLAHLPYSIFLDSADRAHPDARYSFIAAHPVETIEAKDGTITITNSNQQTSFPGDPFEIVKWRLEAWKFASGRIEALPPFQGGAAGLFGYDLARGMEILPAFAAANKNQPDMAVGLYDTVVAFDHHEDKAWIIAHAEDDAAAKKKQDFILAYLKKPLRANDAVQGAVEWMSNFTPATYKSQVQKVIDYILAGDIFQANLSQKFSAQLEKGFDSFAHYRHLRTVNAAPFAAYMNLGAIRVSSASPERFIAVKDGHVETKPIKGTAPRLEGDADEAQKKALQSSEKDRAENIMIVDLLRNDLSKICEPASVNADKLCAVESFAKVHHLVSTVSGRLAEGQKPTDLLRACFPGGSISGAPKIRAMEIIEELEPSRRGPYCGTIGYVSFDGQMDTNILIRTLVYDGNTVSFQVGGGITAESNPHDEYQETLDKAAGMFASFEDGAFPAKAGNFSEKPRIPAYAGKAGRRS